eukprot:TRINITY_DN121333_c0_g1_i1.p1 TRINITY_DN121333_c0_g1~~TRINITY_DN121333_c0_g1_i1.p1  ORF type:complete len:190 (-),score=53.21 TRINITY_DN121333_c0_g1_i1:184-705(-)
MASQGLQRRSRLRLLPVVAGCMAASALVRAVGFVAGPSATPNRLRGVSEDTLQRQLFAASASLGAYFTTEVAARAEEGSVNVNPMKLLDAPDRENPDIGNQQAIFWVLWFAVPAVLLWAVLTDKFGWWNYDEEGNKLDITPGRYYVDKDGKEKLAVAKKDEKFEAWNPFDDFK